MQRWCIGLILQDQKFEIPLGLGKYFLSLGEDVG